MVATGYTGGDPNKLDVDGWAQGDVLAADVTGTLQALPIGTVTEVLTVDTADPLFVDWQPGGGGPGAGVTSFNSRTGNVVPVAGDYAVADVTGLTAALTAKANLAGGAAFTGAVTVGAQAVVVTNDARLSDARTPTAHASTHAAIGSDPVTLTQAQITGLAAALALLAPLASPTFTGTVSGITAAMVGAQPLDSDLTTIAALIPVNDDIVQRKAGAWTNRTIAQLLTDLGLGALYQPLDTDLSTIAGLTATTDNVMQVKAGAWASRTLAQLMTDLAALGTTFQPLDTDLSTIAGLTATTNNMLQSVGSAWASRTPTQVKAALSIAVADVTGAAPTASPTFTGTVTEPAVTRTGRTLRTYTALTDAATIAVDAALNDHFTVTLGGNRTLGNPSNPPGAGQSQMILFAIRQDATGSRTLTLGSDYRLGSDITAVTLSTAVNKTDYLGVRYNATDSKWDVIAFVKGY